MTYLSAAVVTFLGVVLLSTIEDGPAATFVAFVAGVGIICGLGMGFAVWVRGPVPTDEVRPTGVHIEWRRDLAARWDNETAINEGETP